MKLGDLIFKMRLLENFQRNHLRENNNSDVKEMMLRQAYKVVAEVDEAIKNGNIKAMDAVNLVKLYKLQPIMKKVRGN